MIQPVCAESAIIHQPAKWFFIVCRLRGEVQDIAAPVRESSGSQLQRLTASSIARRMHDLDAAREDQVHLAVNQAIHGQHS